MKGNMRRSEGRRKCGKKVGLSEEGKEVKERK